MMRAESGIRRYGGTGGRVVADMTVMTFVATTASSFLALLLLLLSSSDLVDTKDLSSRRRGAAVSIGSLSE